MQKVNFKKLTDSAMTPFRGSEYAAGYDLFSDMPPLRIMPNETVMFKTGISIELPKNTFGAIYARSGMATKRGLRLANSTGVIDEDFTGEVIVALHNDGIEPQLIYHKDKIAQLVIQPYVTVEFDEVDELTETKRGEGGFGSTGK